MPTIAPNAFADIRFTVDQVLVIHAISAKACMHKTDRQSHI